MLEPALRAAANPLVSVVIPTYNRRAMLIEAIDSCFGQTCGSIEVIVVDDGSTDGSRAEVEARYADRLGRTLHYIVQGNAGASAARNRGLAAARGEYVQFLDSDDLLLPEKLSLQTKALAAQPRAEACSCFGLVTAPQPGLAARRIGVEASCPADYLIQLCGRVVHGMQTSAPLWRRSFLAARPGWNERIGFGDDLEYYIRLVADASEVAFVPEDLFVVREHTGPHLSDLRGNPRQVHSAVHTMRSVCQTLRQAGLWDMRTTVSVERRLLSLYISVLRYCSPQDIREYEAWVGQEFARIGRICKLTAAMWMRRFVGRRGFVAIFDGYLHARRWLVPQA